MMRGHIVVLLRALPMSLLSDCTSCSLVSCNIACTLLVLPYAGHIIAGARPTLFPPSRLLPAAALFFPFCPMYHLACVFPHFNPPTQLLTHNRPCMTRRASSRPLASFHPCPVVEM
ncbi:hypothetical protein V8C44DRAFT_80541 [Trichoderma aethiopicum]